MEGCRVSSCVDGHGLDVQEFGCFDDSNGLKWVSEIAKHQDGDAITHNLASISDEHFFQLLHVVGILLLDARDYLVGMEKLVCLY
jgi:hypothetical protein